MSRTRIIPVLISLLSFLAAKSAPDSLKTNRISVKINDDIQSLNKEELVILRNWEGYLNSIDTVQYHSPELWWASEKEKYWFPDIELIEISRRTKRFTKYSPVLLSLQKKDSIYILKTGFISPEKSLHSIFNVVVRKNPQEEFVFSRYQDYHTKDWTSTQVGSIMFFYKDRAKFNYTEAEKSASFSDSLAGLLNVRTFQSKYYVFQNTEERLRGQGYDYTYLMYNTIQESSENDPNNRIINSGIGAEFDPHEIVHTYLNQAYWNSLSNFVDEGIATFLGGNIERSKKKELANLKKYLNEHPDLDLNYVVSIRKHSEGKTNIMYALSAFLCEKVYEKEGMDGLKKLCLAGPSDGDAYPVIEEILNVKQTELNNYLRSEIKNYATD